MHIRIASTRKAGANMKHRIKRILAILMFLFISIQLVPVTSYAESERQYTINIFSGNRGVFTETGSTEYSVTPRYSSNDYSYPSITPADGFYVKGIKIAGQDSIYTAYLATADRDYVVAYGVLGTEVAYTVHYVLYGTTQELAPSQTFYAGVGDRPVSSYIYVGAEYEPYYRTTKTLVRDSTQNVLYAYYRQVSTTTTTTTTTTNIVTDDTVYGDANCNSEVELSDAVIILQSLANSDRYGVNGTDKNHITEQGAINGDVYQNGTGLTAQDAGTIQRYVLKLVSSLPESYK